MSFHTKMFDFKKECRALDGVFFFFSKHFIQKQSDVCFYFFNSLIEKSRLLELQADLMLKNDSAITKSPSNVEEGQ